MPYNVHVPPLRLLRTGVIPAWCNDTVCARPRRAEATTGTLAVAIPAAAQYKGSTATQKRTAAQRVQPTHSRHVRAAAVRALAPSLIREVANAGMGEPDVLPFWFGEPDEVTPAFIRDAGAASLARGETFYTQNLGIPPLREAIAAYVDAAARRDRRRRHRRHGVRHVGADADGRGARRARRSRRRRHAAVAESRRDSEDPVGATSRRCRSTCRDGGWTLDLDRLLAALTPDTRMLLVNSPNNPTGWTLTRDEQQAMLEHCRRHGIWIVADDVYERLYYRDDAHAAPSFLDLADADERVIAPTASRSRG